MADGTNNIWIDSSFYAPSDGERVVDIELFAGDATNIGNYSIPLVFQVNTTSDDSTDVNLEFFLPTAISGVVNISHYYYIPTIPIYISLFDVGFEYNTGDTAVSGTDNLDIIYTTGFNVVSGTLNKVVNMIAGKEYAEVEDTYVNFYNYASASGSLDYWANYTNFSGDYGTGGVPIPYYTSFIDYDVYYYQSSGPINSGTVNNIVDITFAGWIPYTFNADVICALSGTLWNFDFEATAISGAVSPLNTDVYSTNQQVTDILIDVYSTAVQHKYFDSDVNVRDGRLTRFIGDVYSTTQNTTGLDFNVDLYSLKIDNFSLAVDEYASTSGTIYVDVLDDECPISVSGTYMFVGGQEVSLTFEAITDGYRLYYNPDDDFASLEGPTDFLVHTENECGDWLEESFYLTIGIIVEYNNNEVVGNDFGFNKEVLVRIEAEDMATCPSLSSLAWSFTSDVLYPKDLFACIVGTPAGTETRNLGGEIRPKSTAYFYGKEFEIMLTASDFAGNEMTPFALNYKIEDKP